MNHGATSRRLLDLLPAIYREGEAGDGAAASDLPALLAVFDALFFDDRTANAGARLPGIASRLDALPALFAPLGLEADPADPSDPADPDDIARTPARFLPWLASWLAFTPRELLEPWRLRRVVAGIVPLHGRRGTRAHLEALLALCFEEIAGVRIDERGQAGLRVGSSRLGTDSLLAEEQPFRFGVDVALRPGRAGAPAGAPPARLEQQVRAVIDFAKPAHTVYELRLHAVRDGAEASSRMEEPRHA
jgi:phage tail-like protein